METNTTLTFQIGSNTYIVEKMFRNPAKVVGMLGSKVNENVYAAIVLAKSPRCRKAKTYNVLVDGDVIVHAAQI